MDPAQVDSLAAFVEFVEAFRRELGDPDVKWENRSLDDFLEAWSAWIAVTDGTWKNVGGAEPTWAYLAHSLLAARIYE